MKPLREFFIPSVHDGTRLSCRIYQLDGINYQELPALKAAIVAHPYASLGGSNDDPVVASITTELVRKGYIVLTLNFRYVCSGSLHMLHADRLLVAQVIRVAQRAGLANLRWEITSLPTDSS